MRLKKLSEDVELGFALIRRQTEKEMKIMQTSTEKLQS